jgi:hypothetical protein
VKRVVPERGDFVCCSVLVRGIPWPWGTRQASPLAAASSSGMRLLSISSASRNVTFCPAFSKNFQSSIWVSLSWHIMTTSNIPSSPTALCVGLSGIFLIMALNLICLNHLRYFARSRLQWPAASSGTPRSQSFPKTHLDHEELPSAGFDGHLKKHFSIHYVSPHRVLVRLGKRLLLLCLAAFRTTRLAPLHQREILRINEVVAAFLFCREASFLDKLINTTTAHS